MDAPSTASVGFSLWYAGCTRLHGREGFGAVSILVSKRQGLNGSPFGRRDSPPRASQAPITAHFPPAESHVLTARDPQGAISAPCGWRFVGNRDISSFPCPTQWSGHGSLGALALCGLISPLFQQP